MSDDSGGHKRLPLSAPLLSPSTSLSPGSLPRHAWIKNNPRANGAKRRSGRKPGARVTNFVLGELKVVARGS